MNGAALASLAFHLALGMRPAPARFERQGVMAPTREQLQAARDASLACVQSAGAFWWLVRRAREDSLEAITDAINKVDGVYRRWAKDAGPWLAFIASTRPSGARPVKMASTVAATWHEASGAHLNTLGALPKLFLQTNGPRKTKVEAIVDFIAGMPQARHSYVSASIRLEAARALRCRRGGKTSRPQDAESIVMLSQVAALVKQKKRTLQRHIENGLLPRPDFPAKKTGQPHRWRWSTLRGPLRELFPLGMIPGEFPGH